MNTFSLILDGGVFLLIGGIFLSLYSLMLTLGEVILHLWRRVFLSWATRRLQDMGIVRKNENHSKSDLNINLLLLWIIIPILAIIVRDILLSPLVICFGWLLAWWVNFYSRQKERAMVNEDSEMAALQMRSLISVDRSLLNTLSGIKLPDGLLNRSIQQVISRLQMHQPPQQAALALRGLPGTVTTRLAALIANSAQMTDQLQSDLLVSLEREAHHQKLLRSRIRQTLALVRGTIRLLQGVVAAAMVFVLLSPIWRDFFLQDIPHRTLLTILMSAAMLGSFYFEVEVYQLGSGEAF